LLQSVSHRLENFKNTLVINHVTSHPSRIQCVLRCYYFKSTRWVPAVQETWSSQHPETCFAWSVSGSVCWELCTKKIYRVLLHSIKTLIVY